MKRFVFCLTVLCVLSGSVYRAEAIPITSGLIGYWPGDGNANDESGNNNHGTLKNGATFGSGQVGQAFSFDGVDDYVEAPDSSLWAFGTSDLTIDLWANFQSLGSGDVPHPEVIFIGNNEGAGELNKWVFALGGGRLYFHINSPTILPALFFVQAPFAPNFNQWYNLGVTKSGNTYTIFVDGVAVGSETDSTATEIPDANAPLEIARNPREDAGNFHGRLDEIAIYNRALSQNEIQTLSGSAPIPEPSTLLLFGIGALGMLGYGWWRRGGCNAAKRRY